MKAFKYLILTIFLSSFSLHFSAQTMEALMVFETEKHEFGKINEEKGKVEFKFVFTNMGAEPISIDDVTSSCGCTTPSWSKEPIPPGGKGYINAVYNPKNRPGSFHKTVTVKSNASNSPITLHISGEVIAKPEDDIASVYKFTKGPVKMDKGNLHFDDMFNDESKSDVIKVYNYGEEDVTITFNEKQNLPKHLNVICKPETLKPGQKGEITVSYNAKLKNDYGYVYDRIYINFNHEQDYNNRLTVSTVIKERFSQEMIDNPPVFTMINDATYDFGTIHEGDKVEYTFRFKNTGKNDLIIRKTKASCGCTAIEPKDKVIKPGQESSITAIFNSKGKKGKQHKSVTITTNIPDIEGEPRKSEIILLLKGNVEPANTGQND